MMGTPVQDIIPAQTYPVGATWKEKMLPGDQAYSRAKVTVDFSPWVSPATTRVDVWLGFSFDSGQTWQRALEFSQVDPPPYPARDGGSSSTTTVPGYAPRPRNPTHVRLGIRVTGAAVPLGQIVVDAS